MRRWFEQPLNRHDYERMVRVVWLIISIAICGAEYVMFALLQRLLFRPDWFRTLIGIAGSIVVLWTSWKYIQAWRQKFWEHKD